MRLANKVAVVTGGGGGIGKATSIRFAEEGAKLIVSDVNQENAEATVNVIKANGGEATFVQTDVSDPKQVEDLMKAAVETYGGIDILFNNAGIGNGEYKISELSIEEWDKVNDINLKGVFVGMKYAIPEMMKRGGGSIINTSSVLGLKGKKYMSAYNASKGGLITLTQNAALEYGGDNIRVNAIAPGVINTPIVDHWRDNEWKWNIISKASALKRIGEPEEVANAVLFLASDESSYVTGSTLLVDGGGFLF